MTVYIDILFLLNLAVDYCILSLTSRLNGGTAGFLRQLCGAGIGALFSFIIFLPTQPLLLELVIRLTFSALIVLCAYGFGGWRRFLRLMATFYVVSFLYAGLMLAVWFVCHPAGMAVHNGIVYFNISPIMLIAGTALGYGAIWLLRRFMKRPAASGERRRVEIMLNGRRVEVNALVDTGHSLSDIMSDQPVIVTALPAVQPLIPLESLPAFLHVGSQPAGDMAERYRLIPYSVVGGGGLLPAFRCDDAKIEVPRKEGNRPHSSVRRLAAQSPERPICLEKKERLSPAIVAVSVHPLSGDYDAIISPEWIEGEKYKKRSKAK